MLRALAMVVAMTGLLTAPVHAADPITAAMQQAYAPYRLAMFRTHQTDVAAAHDKLEAVRDLLAALRQRNQVTVFSDPMNAYHEAMESVLDEGPALLGQPQGWIALAEHAGVLHHLAQRLKVLAPPQQRADPDFAPRLQGCWRPCRHCARRSGRAMPRLCARRWATSKPRMPGCS